MSNPNPYTPPVIVSPAETRPLRLRITYFFLVATPLICFVFGTAAGTISRMVRDDNAGMHYEALVEMAAKILANVFTLIVCMLFRKAWMRFLSYGLATTLLWGASTLAWTIMNGAFFYAHLVVNAISLMVAMLVGVFALFAVQLIGKIRHRNRRVNL